MNLFDLFVIIVVTGLGILGFREGLVRGVINLAGFIAMIILLNIFSGQVILAARSFEGIPPAAAVPLMFLAILVAGTVTLHIVALALHKLIHLTPVGFIDSGLGIVLGMVKALYFCAFLAILLSFSPESTALRRQYESSAAAPELVRLLRATIPYVTKSLEPYLDKVPASSAPSSGDTDNDRPSDDLI